MHESSCPALFMWVLFWGLNSGTHVCKQATVCAISPGSESFLRETFGLGPYYQGSVPTLLLLAMVFSHTLAAVAVSSAEFSVCPPARVKTEPELIAILHQ